MVPVDKGSENSVGRKQRVDNEGKSRQGDLHSHSGKHDGDARSNTMFLHPCHQLSISVRSCNGRKGCNAHARADEDHFV